MAKLNENTKRFRAVAEKAETANAIEQVALNIWLAMNESERHGVKFGLFPAGKMEEAERAGYDGHALAVALMKLGG